MLYIIATPIGNLKDITIRAIETLEKVDILLCEDTRVTANLLHLLGIKNKPELVSFYDEVEEQKIPQVVKFLEDGKEVGLVTDAGTPLISDPGWKLVKRLETLGLPYTAIPGACAVIDGLVLSGIATNRFVFLGFLSKKAGKRKELLDKYKDKDITKVAYESPFRVAKLIKELKNYTDEVKVVREMTKKFESVEANVKDDRGECVVVWR